MTVVGHGLGRKVWAVAMGALGGLLCAIGLVTSTTAGAAEAAVGLGTADSFAVLAGAGVTNTGPSTISGDLGTCPTPAVTGFPPGTVSNGSIHADDAVACGAQSDLTVAYDDAAGRAPTTTYAGPTDLVGLTLTTGVYKSPSSFANAGTLTLDGQGDANAVFIFQAGTTLITASGSHVVLINSAQACNVFWQVGSSATLGTDSTFVGTILALTSITADTSAAIQGRLLARNGAVTLDSNTVTRSSCAAVPTTTTAAAAGASTTTSAAATSTTTASVTTTTLAQTTTAPPTTTTTAAPTVATTTTTAATTTTTGAPAVATTIVATPALTTTTKAGGLPPGPSTGTGNALPPAVSPGDSTVVSGGGFTPAATLTITMGGGPAVPASTMSDVNGRYSVSLRVPMASLGSQRVVVSGLGSNGEARRSITTIQVKARGGLAVTGGRMRLLGLLGLAMIGLGSLIAVAPRQRCRRATR